MLKCDGNDVKTPIVKGTCDPIWKWRVTLYRDTPKTDIVVEVLYSHIKQQHHCRVLTASKNVAYSKQVKKNELLVAGVAYCC